MYPLAILVMTTWLMVSYAQINERHATERISTLEGDAASMNFLSYRAAVVSYLVANPSATGTVADSALTWPNGFVRDARWTNVISGGQLYVYSAAAPPGSMLDFTYQKVGGSYLVGLKQTNGDLTGPRGNIAAALPSGIPVGAIVYMGK